MGFVLVLFDKIGKLMYPCIKSVALTVLVVTFDDEILKLKFLLIVPLNLNWSIYLLFNIPFVKSNAYVKLFFSG